MLKINFNDVIYLRKLLFKDDELYNNDFNNNIVIDNDNINSIYKECNIQANFNYPNEKKFYIVLNIKKKI